jgi:hypothetical protein
LNQSRTGQEVYGFSRRTCPVRHAVHDVRTAAGRLGGGRRLLENLLRSPSRTNLGCVGPPCVEHFGLFAHVGRTDGSLKVPTVVPRGAEIGAIRLASDTSRPARDCTENGETEAGTGRQEKARNPGKNGVSRTSPHQAASICKAEREGFEPSVGLLPHRFSRPARSAAPAPLREGQLRLIRASRRLRIQPFADTVCFSSGVYRTQA